jgi:hypothetical protein
MKKMLLLAGAALVAASAIAYAQLSDDRHAEGFYPGHTHDENGLAVGAPAHSGGTDSYGCHNGSVRYHCH